MGGGLNAKHRMLWGVSVLNVLPAVRMYNCPIRGAQMDDVQQLAGELNHAAQCVAEGYVTWADIRQMLKEYGVETALE